LFTTEYEYEYDSHGRQTKVSGFVTYVNNTYVSSRILSSIQEYEYDSNGRQTKYSVYGVNVVSSKIEYEYDSNGNQTKVAYYSANGELQNIYTYIYIYSN